MLIRYATLAGAAAIAFYGATHISADDKTMMLVDAGRSGFGPDLSIWLLALLVAVMVISICRQIASNTDTSPAVWVETNKTWLITGTGMLFFAASYVM